MKVIGSLAFIASLLAAATPALCQQVSDNPQPSTGSLQRYIAGFVGVAPIASDTTFTFAGEFGESVARSAQAYANFSYLDNVMTDQMRQNLVLAGEAVTQLTGVPRSFSGRDRGLAFTVGGKFAPGTRIRPYVGAGAGGLNIRRTVTEATLGDVSEAFAAQTGFGDGVISAGSTSATKPLAEVVAGIGFVTSKTYVDIGYRYRHAFHSATTVDFSQFTAGIGAKW